MDPFSIHLTHPTSFALIAGVFIGSVVSMILFQIIYEGARQKQENDDEVSK